MALSRAWTAPLLATTAALPISYVYGDRPIQGIPPEWEPTCHRRRIDANIVESVYEGSGPDGALRVRVEVAQYLDHPVVEWTAWFVNDGSGPTPIIRDISGIETLIPGTRPSLYRCNGDFNSEAGYSPTITRLVDGQEVVIAPRGGRPCDGAFPYFRVAFAGCGFTLAIGWPGQWSARFRGTGAGVWLRAGQEQTHLRLLPGERIRTPRITLLSWTGDEERAVNLWRRWYLDHVLPRPNGIPLQPLLAAAGTDEGEEFTGATEENQIRFMDRFTSEGFAYDVWWIDAGWYPCSTPDHGRDWRLTGTWEPDRERFPRGLGPVSENAAKNGAAQLLWLEPERVAPGTALHREHPEWLLSAGEQEAGGSHPVRDSSLLDLGNPDCRTWLTDHVSNLISDNGIKIYRQDFNFQPLDFWRANDAYDRQGITENLHVQGYLRFWDDLLARHPGLWIDSCASGGRRNDLETMRRAVPLHYSDYGYGIHPVKLAFHRTLYEWIPYFKESTLSWDVRAGGEGEAARTNRSLDSFSFHCALAAMLSLAIDIRRDDYDLDLARRMVAVWRRCAPHILFGDYYPLSPSSRDGRSWTVWQFDRPELGCGLLQVIRHAAAPDHQVTVRLRALSSERQYLFENPETEEVRAYQGAELLERGLDCALPPREGAVWLYQLIGRTITGTSVQGGVHA